MLNDIKNEIEYLRYIKDDITNDVDEIYSFIVSSENFNSEICFQNIEEKELKNAINKVLQKINTKVPSIADFQKFELIDRGEDMKEWRKDSEGNIWECTGCFDAFSGTYRQKIEISL